MRSMQWQLGILGAISAFAYRHRETEKNLCRGGRSQDLPNTDFQPAVRHLKHVELIVIINKICYFCIQLAVYIIVSVMHGHTNIKWKKECSETSTHKIRSPGSHPKETIQYSQQAFKARLHGSPRLINAVESTKVNRVNSSFQRK